MTDIQTPADGEFRDGAQPAVTTEPQCPVGSAGRMARWWSLVLDGRHDWGSVDVGPTRHGVTRTRLVVFPPGIDTVERRLLRAWRAWPAWGALIWVISQIVVGAFLTPGAAFASSTCAFLASGAILFARVSALRARVRTLAVVRIAGYADEHSAARHTELKLLVAALCHADDQREQGHWSAIDHEAAWWQVYDRLDQSHHG
jgi:hypothetical protein